MELLRTLFWSFGLVVFLLGIQGMLYFPLTIAYEIWKRRALRRLAPFRERVSVVVPAYNEERTIRVAVETLLESEYPDLEVIVVDDGSQDGTADRLLDLHQQGRIRLIRQQNAGKAAALNAGIAAATGEVVLYTDADSLFLRETVAKTVRWFADPSVDAVCGNDVPLRARTGLQKLLAVTTHIGTGYVRRALSVIGCLPIISGNLGAVRRRVLDEIGGFRQLWGEDLEITWRLHRHRKRIVFDPEPVVLADCPATFAALWKQRVRWMRSYLKVAALHRGLFFRRDAWPFSLYLPVNFVNMALVPALQAFLLLALPLALTRGWLPIDGPWEVASWLGLSFFFAVAIYAILLDRDPGDLLYLPWGALIVPVSYFYNAVARRLGPEPAVPRSYGFAVSLVAVAIAGGVATWTWMMRERAEAPAFAAPHLSGEEAARPAFHLSVSTHFDAWPDWRDATRKVLDRPLIDLGEMIGIGAGRTEWTYFRWAKHEDRWSNHQRGEAKDLLLIASRELHGKGFKVAAFIDLYAPKWIQTHPGTGAIQADGAPHPEQVSLTELAEGEFGNLVVEMIGYIAANYPVDAIDVTEAAYRHTSFGSRDLASYAKATGRAAWPRDWRGRVDVEKFVSRAAAAAHEHGKPLYLDVAASWKDLRRDGKDHGHDYARLQRVADRLVVWNYFALEGLPPSASRDLAARLSSTLMPGRWTLSLGLWGRDGKAISPADLSAALAASIEGGARHIWVTPNDQITDAHWNAVLRRWLVPLKPQVAPTALQAQP